MGPDGISPKLLLETKEQICYPLYLLFRKSLDESLIPENWKQGLVTPIHKKVTGTMLRITGLSV